MNVSNYKVLSRHFFRRNARAMARTIEVREGIDVRVVKAQRAPWRWLVVLPMNERP